MSKAEKTLSIVLRGTSDANVPFKDLCSLLLNLGRFSPDGTAEIPRHNWAGGQFRISRGWLHGDLQEVQYLFLLRSWGAVLIELSAVDRDSVARDLR